MTEENRGPVTREEEILKLLGFDIETHENLSRTLALCPDEDMSHITHPSPRYTPEEVWDAICRLLAVGAIIPTVWRKNGRYEPVWPEEYKTVPREKVWFQLVEKQ